MAEWPWGQIISHALIFATSLMGWLRARSVDRKLNGHMTSRECSPEAPHEQL